MSKNIVWHKNSVKKEDRIKSNRHKPLVLWFTGLSGSGKSTLANMLECRLFENGIKTFLLDGDNIRHGLCNDLGFGEKDRKENIRRVAEVSRLFVDAGNVTLVSFISPFQKDRDFARSIMDKHEFYEIHIKCSLECCEQRDPKNLYKKARAGEIKDFTGIDSPYEDPVNPDLVLDTEKYSAADLVESIHTFTLEKIKND